MILFLINLKMSNINQFEDKATRLLNRLSTIGVPNKASKLRPQSVARSPSVHQLVKIRQEIDVSDAETRKKIKGVNDNLQKLLSTLVIENQNRVKMDETFSQTVVKLQKNMKVVLSTVTRSFNDKEKKLNEKIQVLIKTEKKEIQSKFQQNDELLQCLHRLETKVMTIVDEVSALRKSRLELEQKINRQFTEQIKELKRIFENDVKERQDRETKSVNSLKHLYKSAMERIYSEEKEREQSQKMLISVVQQLVNHIIQA